MFIYCSLYYVYIYILVVHILKHCGDGHRGNSCASAFCCQCACVVQELKTSGFKGTSFRINIACWLIACSRAIKAIARHYVYTATRNRSLDQSAMSMHGAQLFSYTRESLLELWYSGDLPAWMMCHAKTSDVHMKCCFDTGILFC